MTTLPEMPPRCKLIYEQRFNTWQWVFVGEGEVVVRLCLPSAEAAARDCWEYFS